ncbi:hypothetical protein OSTOST_23719 [Ostertagia ostertagi]
MGRYDPTSIMHYNFPGIVYPRTYFSVSDVLRINTLYRCPKQASTLPGGNDVYNKDHKPTDVVHSKLHELDTSIHDKIRT